MKKYITHIILFFAIVIAIDLCFGEICAYMNSHAKGGMTKQKYDLCLKDQYDVLIMGSSRAHRHYVPQIFEDTLGLSCYNAGYDGNGIILMYGIYQMIVNRYQPKMIIYDVENTFDLYEYKQDNNCTRYLAGLKPYYQQPGIMQIFKDVSYEEYYKVHSGLCRNNSTFIPMLIDCFKIRPMDVKGFSPMSGVMKKEPKAETTSASPVVDSLKMKYLRFFFEDVTYRGIPLLLVFSPKYGAFSSDDYQPIKSLCEEFDIPYIDYYANKELTSNKEWFREPMHLNESGATIFSGMIASNIKAMFLNK